MLPTDITAPTTGVLSRLSDPRVQQYWDEDHVLANRLKHDAREPQPIQECCVRNGILWDLAALYPPQVRWEGAMPPAVVFNGPVVDVIDGLASSLAALPSRQ